MTDRTVAEVDDQTIDAEVPQLIGDGSPGPLTPPVVRIVGAYEHHDLLHVDLSVVLE
jgi:hypothetical protein